jgi:hypothetical protein
MSCKFQIIRSQIIRPQIIRPSSHQMMTSVLCRGLHQAVGEDSPLQLIGPDPIRLIGQLLRPEPSFLSIICDGNSIGYDNDSCSVTWMTNSQRLSYGARLDKDWNNNGHMS